MPAILLSIVVGGVLAFGLAYVTAPNGSEPLVTGSVLLAFGIGWALMAWLTTKFSGQPQRWLYVPAALLGSVGAVLAVLQPAPAFIDLLGWVWPVAGAVLAIWMFLQLRRELRGFGRWLVGALTAVLLLMAVAGAAITVTTASASQPSGQGQLVDIGGRRLYLECTGSGSPTVVLQAGAGGDSTAWKRIQPTVAAKTTVCAYDRAGRGRSDLAPALQDGTAIARDLDKVEGDAIDRDRLLANVSIYWFTQSGASAARFLYESAHSGQEWGAPSKAPQGWALFAAEPFVREVIDPEHRIAHWSEFDRGGHFAAMETPDLLVDDIRTFFRALR